MPMLTSMPDRPSRPVQHKQSPLSESWLMKAAAHLSQASSKLSGLHTLERHSQAHPVGGIDFGNGSGPSPYTAAEDTLARNPARLGVSKEVQPSSSKMAMARPSKHDESAAQHSELIRAINVAVPPNVARNPYPTALVPLRSNEGLTLLEGSVGPFQEVVACFEGQGPLQCGVSSLTIGLNLCRPSSEPPFTVHELQEELRATLRPRHRFFSAALDELGALGKRYADVHTILASDVNCSDFRQLASSMLEAGGAVIVNFERQALGYASSFSGHCSPVAAYNPSADEFLVMDVAIRSWQPVWVPTSLLFKGISTMDEPRDVSVKGMCSRGFLLINPSGAPPLFINELGRVP